jgi:DNA-binding XRE family transcriptional regulator
MTRQFAHRNGKRYALVDPSELQRLERLAAKAQADELPPWPPADAEGNRPAIEFARVSIARTIIEERLALGISQQKLARLAGLRQETVSRLESGKHSPTIRTVEKIDRALRKAAQQGQSAPSKTKAISQKRKQTR